MSNLRKIGKCSALLSTIPVLGGAFKLITNSPLCHLSTRCVRQPIALFTAVSKKHRSFPLFSSIEDDGDLPSNSRTSSIGGNFFEEVPTAANRNREDQNQRSIQDMEMLTAPFDEHLPKINVVTLVGRVGNDPEPRYFDDGKVVLNLSLAVKRKYHPLERKVRGIRSGEEETDWFPLEFWGRDAEYVASYVEKGARLGITGSLVGSEWVDRMTGEQRRRPKILVRHIDILESRAEAELRRGQKGGGKYSGGGNRDGASYGDDDDDGPAPASSGGFFDT